MKFGNEKVQKLFLGFGHEHTRADRDRHVRINFGIIQRGVEGNFKIIPHQFWDSLGTRYETRSVMHYGSYAGSFSKLFKNQLKSYQNQFLILSNQRRECV